MPVLVIIWWKTILYRIPPMQRLGTSKGQFRISVLGGAILFGGHIIFWPLSWGGGKIFWASVKRVPSTIFVHSEVAGYLSLCQWQLLSPKALKTPFSCVMLLRSMNSKNQTSVKKISVPVPTIPVNSGISLSSVHFTYYIETCFGSNGCIIL